MPRQDIHSGGTRASKVFDTVAEEPVEKPGMPTLAVTNFNVVCATLGGFITLFGLVSYLFKEQFYLSEARKLLSPCVTGSK